MQKPFQHPSALFDSKELNPLFPMEMGSDANSLYYKTQQIIDKEKESPSKSVSSSNIGMKNLKTKF